MSKSKNNLNQSLCYRCGWGFFGDWACEKGNKASCNCKPVERCDLFDEVKDERLRKEDLARIFRKLKEQMQTLSSDINNLQGAVREEWNRVGPGPWEDYLEDAMDMLSTFEQEANAMGDWFVNHINKIKELR